MNDFGPPIDVRAEMARKCVEAQRAQDDWLEDVLAGLLAAGCTGDEIEVQRFQSDPGRVVVGVRGVQKYEHRITMKY